MKSAFAIILVVLLGVALGVGVALLRIRVATWDPKTDQTVETPSLPPTTGPTPKVVVDRTDYEFGTLDITASGSHDFVLTNAGDAMLTLSKGETSCRCAMSQLEREKIPPGRSAKVTITWKPTESSGPYRQTAVILTNDPDRPRVTLTISGQIVTAARFSPSELVFSRLTAGEIATAQSRLFCYLDEPLKILGQTWSDAATAPFFDADVRPLAADELKDDPSARSGVLVRVTLKPGLPQGPVQQKLLLKTNVKSAPTETLPIEGVIGSEIAVVGQGWNPDTGVLNLGEVSRREGLQRRLMLVIRGPLRKKVEFQMDRIAPDVLKASLGRPREINNGVVVQVPLTIDIAPNSPSANHLGSQQGKLGEILLKTTHPNVPELRILVRFAVEG